ncbi:MAG: 23S rRNA (adenine(2503)-C(2))-methyltransferase RlmN [Clostridia bacterium]|nr:23S rRNA (adenine(2503)-C(2))-methyltransferase RlmN [Clostridia bacterium]
MNIYDHTLSGLAGVLKDEPAFRAKQIYKWLFAGTAVEEMTNIPKALREKLKANYYTDLPRIYTKLVSKIDGTVKYLFLMEDGAGIESVVMPYKHGLTICVSTQVGCRMGCSFCASTVDGLLRNLTAGEIAGQVLAAQKDLGKPIRHIVMMGSGEPLDNFDNVMTFLENAMHEEGMGISARHITLSTCGLIDGIRRLEEKHLKINLAISLHAPTDALRRRIMPVAKSTTVEALTESCVDYFRSSGRRITFEYALIRDVNDRKEHAMLLAKLLKKDAEFHVNLIPVNSIREKAYQKSERHAVAEFAEILKKAGIEATVRRKMGADINAACGQLRKTVLDETKGNSK